MRVKMSQRDEMGTERQGILRPTSPSHQENFHSLHTISSNLERENEKRHQKHFSDVSLNILYFLDSDFSENNDSNGFKNHTMFPHNNSLIIPSDKQGTISSNWRKI